MKKPLRMPAMHAECLIREALDCVGNKWSCLILLALAESPMRFGEFRTEIDGISQRALVETLQSLRRDGLVARDLVSRTPPSICYRLTDLGESLVGPVRRLERWAMRSKFAILRHREVFDDAEARARTSPTLWDRN
jgi:DNA-binding HxlR family transcriptional regulator